MKNLWLMLFVAPMLTYAGTTVQEEDYAEPIGQYELAMDDDSLADETFQSEVAAPDEISQNYDEMLSEEATEEFIETAPVVAERSTASKQVAQTQQQRKNVSGNRQTNVNRSQAGNNS